MGADATLPRSLAGHSIARLVDTTELFQIADRREANRDRQRILLRKVLIALSGLSLLLSTGRFVVSGLDARSSWVLFGAGFVFAFGLLLLRTEEGLPRATALIVWAGQTTIVGAAYIEGGLLSGALYWLPFVPFMATILGSEERLVVISCIVSIATVAAMGITGPLYVTLPGESPGMNALRAMALCGAVGFGGFVATAIERERQERQKQLWRKASHHPLTGLKSRDFFMDILQLSVERARRQSTTLGLIFVDLDGLKKANDAHGHAAGDVLIIESARRIDESTRGGDVVCHLGGDEFTVMVEPCRDVTEVVRIAERIRSAVTEKIEWKGPVLEAAASIGVAIHAPPESPQDLIRRADRAMYEAKRAGGNNVRVDPIRPVTSANAS